MDFIKILQGLFFPTLSHFKERLDCHILKLGTSAFSKIRGRRNTLIYILGPRLPVFPID